MDLIVERLNGTKYKFSDYNISIEDFTIDSPLPRFNWETVDGRDGLIDLGTTYSERKLSGSFEFVANDFLDFPLLRNEIFRILDSRESFYLIDDREPGKRWLVKANGFSIEQLIANRGKFNTDFISPSTYAESIGTTLSPKTFDSEVFQFGQGLILDDTSYIHNVSSFSVYNAGDITVDPRERPLLITFKGASTNLQIKNLTTGETWSYTGNTAAGDTITLDGVKSLKNSISILGDTNRKLITIKNGWNDFEITGANSPFEVSFDFRFYYL